MPLHPIYLEMGGGDDALAALGRQQVDIDQKLSLAMPQRLSELAYDTLLPLFGSTLSPATVQRVFSTIRARGVPDYASESEAFCYLYFSANFVKAYLAAIPVLRSLKDESTSLVDLGAGSGAATAGVVAAAADLGVHFGNIVAVDACEHQLQLFDRITRAWITIQSPRARVHVIESDVLPYLLLGRDWSKQLVVSSYLRCGLGTSLGEYESALRPIVSKAATVLEIDQRPGARGTFVRVKGGPWAKMETDQLAISGGRLAAFPLKMAPKYCNEARSDRVALPLIVRTFFDAIAAPDEQQVRSIFHADATWELLRFERSPKRLAGTHQIAAFLKRGAECREDFEWRVNGETVDVNRERVYFPWASEFFRQDTNTQYMFSGRMTLHLLDGRISQVVQEYRVDEAVSRRGTIRAPSQF